MSDPSAAGNTAPANELHAGLDIGRRFSGEIGTRTGHRMHPHLPVRLAWAARGTVADECGEPSITSS